MDHTLIPGVTVKRFREIIWVSQPQNGGPCHVTQEYRTNTRRGNFLEGLRLDLAKHDLAVVAIPADGSEVQYVKRYSYADFLESGEELRPMHFTLPCDKIIDMVKIVYNRNCVYQTAYHMIWARSIASGYLQVK